MLNYLNKFVIIETLTQNNQQIVSSAHTLDDPNAQVIITQLKKAALPIPLDAESIIRSFSSLKFLEEDAESWYVITKKFDGVPLLTENMRYSDTSFHLSTENFKQFLNLVKNYETLATVYQSNLLDPSQFLLCDNRIIAHELIDLTKIEHTSFEFATVRSQFLQLVSHFIAKLIHTEPDNYNQMNWTPCYDISANFLNLSQLSDYWLTEIDNNLQKVKPTPLNELYVVDPQNAQTPAAIRRQKEAERLGVIESLQQSSKKRTTGIRPAIALTLAAAVILTGIFVLPGIFDSFKQVDKPKNIVILDNKPAETTPASTGAEVDVDPLEKLTIDQIDFLTDNLQYDTAKYHTGDRSIKLTLDKNHPLGSFSLKGLTLSKNTNLTLWMMSDKMGSAALKLSFYYKDKLIKTIHYNASFESDDTWYMINPFSLASDLNLSNADRMVVDISGDPQTLWIDDISLESYK